MYKHESVWYFTFVPYLSINIVSTIHMYICMYVCICIYAICFPKTYSVYVHTVTT